jgi:hypothetical protein
VKDTRPPLTKLEDRRR